MGRQGSLPPEYFENMFRRDNDPWKFATSPYETEKFSATVAALGERIYTAGFEVGCANGVLTEQLAPHCSALFAIDVSSSALALARSRCSSLQQVTFAEMQFPDRYPAQCFDLIIMSEVVYYWSRDDIRRAAAFVENHLERNGDLLLVHWTGDTDYPHSGDDAVGLLCSDLPLLIRRHAQRAEKYRLDLLRKP